MSNSDMETSHDIQQRLTDLEIKASFTEDLFEQLDRVVVRQQQQIDVLLRELAQLRHASAQGSAPGARDLRDDLPPHY